MKRFLIVAALLAFSAPPAAAAPFEWPTINPGGGAKGCAVVKLLPGQTCTEDEFGNPIITGGAFNLDGMPNEPQRAFCRFIQGKDCPLA